MSTTLAEPLHDRLCAPDCECNSFARNLTPADIHGSPKADLMAVVKAQSETTPLGWWQVFCVEDDGHMETALSSLDAFTEEILELGWSADSVERGTAVCKSCANREPELSEREIWEDAKVYEARGK